MITKQYTFYAQSGEELSISAPDTIEFPSFNLGYYNTLTACGAGEGIGDKLVPETIWGVRVTLACFVHDYMWELSEASWADFHHSNAVFLSNINAVILALSNKSRVNVMKNLRMYRAVTYFNSVDTVGAELFWLSKEV